MSRASKILLIVCLLTAAAAGQVTRNQVRRDVFGVAWNGDRNRAPSADAVYDVLLGIVPVGTDPNLIAIAALNATANQFFYWTGPGTVALTNLSAYMRGLLDDPNQAVFHASINLEIGVDVQAYDPNLTLWAGYEPNDFQLADPNLTLWAGYEPNDFQLADPNLTLWAGYEPNDFQLADPNLTLWAGYEPNDFQPADPNLTYWANYDPNDYVPSTDFPDSNDPDVTAPGQIGRDRNDHTLRGHDGTDQYVYGMRDKTIQFTRTHPYQDCNDFLPVWSNDTSFDFKLTRISAWCDIDNSKAWMYKCDPNGSTIRTVDTVSITTDGNDLYYTTVAAGFIDDPVIEPGKLLIFIADPSTDPNWIKLTIRGYYDANKD
jgi:hypothetical protein